MSARATYITTVNHCGNDIDVFAETVSECPTCLRAVGHVERNAQVDALRDELQAQGFDFELSPDGYVLVSTDDGMPVDDSYHTFADLSEFAADLRNA